MIKVGISGAASPEAGELIRILVNHPDVDLIAAVAPELFGRAVSSHHHGLIGETSLLFDNTLDLSAIDVIFFAPGSDKNELDKALSLPELKVIDLSGYPTLRENVVPAVSELFRKQMVRGASHAQVVHPLSSLLTVALFPLASHLMLNSDLNVKIEAPDSIISDSDISTTQMQVSEILKRVQKSFSGNISFEASGTSRNRSTKLSLSIPNTLSLDEVDRIYDSVYDDHNFSFITHTDVGPREVSGTHKCIISLSKPDVDTLNVSIIGDCRMRGGAGDAVHAFNLLFGLFEKTGLSMKAAKF